MKLDFMGTDPSAFDDNYYLLYRMHNIFFILEALGNVTRFRPHRNLEIWGMGLRISPKRILDGDRPLRHWGQTLVPSSPRMSFVAFGIITACF